MLRRFAAALALLLVVTTPAAAMTVLPLDLPAMTDAAARIFVGRVESVTTGRDASGLPATWTTFAVAEGLKGTTGDHVTVKQLGARLGADRTVLPHPALPRYEVGEAVVLFVHAESPIGFTSPVGLGQGCFRVREDAGAAVVVNDVGNRNLAAGRAAAAPQPQPATTTLPLDAFLAEVRALVAAKR